MITKDKYPIAVLEALQPWINRHGDLYTKETPNKNYLVSYKSNDYPDFIFRISAYKSITPTRVSFEIIMKPASNIDISHFKQNAWSDEIEDYYNKWCSYLETYKKLQNPHELEEDIVFQQSLDNMYETVFELVDDDANSNSFSIKQQLAIDLILERSIKLLNEYKEKDNDNTIDKIIEEAQEVRDNQQNWVKSKVIRGLARMFTYTKKKGVPFFKDFIKDLFKDGLKEAFKGIIRGNIDDIVGLLG